MRGRHSSENGAAGGAKIRQSQRPAWQKPRAAAQCGPPHTASQNPHGPPAKSALHAKGGHPQIAEPARPECRLAPMRPRRAGGMILAHLGKAAGQPHPRDPAKEIMQKFGGTDATSVHAISAGCMCAEVRQPPKPYEGQVRAGDERHIFAATPQDPDCLGSQTRGRLLKDAPGRLKFLQAVRAAADPGAPSRRQASGYCRWPAVLTAGAKSGRPGTPCPVGCPSWFGAPPVPSRLPPVHEAVPDGAARPVGLQNACSLYCHVGAAGPSACMAVRCHTVPWRARLGPGPCASLVAPGGGNSSNLIRTQTFLSEHAITVPWQSGC